MDFGRVLTAIVTPFDKAMQIDYGLVRELVERLIGQGSDGFVVCGTTGESPTLTHDEKLRMFATVREAAAGRVSVIANTGSYDTAESVALTKEAAEIGVDGAMAVVPYYNKPTQAGLLSHFSAISEATDLPLILYNIPGRTCCLMSVETTVRLSHVPNIVAVKDAVGDSNYTAAVAGGAKEGFLIYSGDDARTLPILADGGHGVICVVSHVAGPGMQAMIQAFLAGDQDKATRLNDSLVALCKALSCTTNPIGIKCALQEDGIDVGGLRLPMTPATDEERAIIREALAVYRRQMRAS